MRSNNDYNDVQIDIYEQENDYDEEEFDQEYYDDEEQFSDIPKNELKEQKKNSRRISTRRSKPSKMQEQQIKPNNAYDFDLNDDQNQNSSMQNFFEIDAEQSNKVINLEQDSNQLPFSQQSLIIQSINQTPTKVNQNEGSVSVEGRVTRNRLRGLQDLILFTHMKSMKKRVREALKNCDNNSDRAAEQLFSHADDPESDHEMTDVNVSHDTACKYSDKKPSFCNSMIQIMILHQSWYDFLMNLNSFITHLGTSTEYGHYVCHIKKDGQWVQQNDAKVAQSNVLSIGKDYMYFFRKIEKDAQQQQQ